MKRRPGLREKLSRALCDKRELNRKVLRIKRSLDEISALLDKSVK